jgi:hypothetical protein
MGYDHSCSDEQAGHAASQPPPMGSGSESQMPNMISEARGLAKVHRLLPLEAQRLILEGAIVLVVGQDDIPLQDLAASPIGLRVEIGLHRPRARELKRLVSDRSLLILCSENDPKRQQRITETLQRIGYKHIFTVTSSEVIV